MCSSDLKVIGKKNIQKKGKCIYACNHLSCVDIPLTQVHMPGFRRYIGKTEFKEKKFSSFMLRHFGVIFVDREKPSLSSMREIFSVLNNDGQIFLFPEGTRNKGDEKTMLELKGGLAIFATKSQSPVVPVIIYNRSKMFRKNYIYYGEPIVLESETGKIPSAEEIGKLTKQYTYEMEKCRIILDDYVANKRWKKKNALPDGVKCDTLVEFENKNTKEEIDAN